MSRRRRAVPDQRHRPQHGGADDPPSRHRGAEAPLPAAAASPPTRSGARASPSPDAGSDLASVQTSAVRDGDNWIINGHKVWTSLAHFASWMILLARTDTTDKYDGLTYFIVPIAGAKGVTVRPLIKITGETGFNEVLFEDVVVPDALRVDEVGKGWTVAMTTLLHERGAAEGAGSGGGASLEDRIAGARSRWPSGRSATAGRPGTIRLRDRVDAARRARRGLPPDVPPRARRGARPTTRCASRCRRSCCQRARRRTSRRVGVEIAGAHASLYLGDRRAPDGGDWPLAYMNSYGITIAAGTERDPAQHPRRARARPGEDEVRRRDDDTAEGLRLRPRRAACCATRRASSCATTSAIETLRRWSRAITTRPTRARCRRAPWDEELWRQMVELGWTALAVPEAAGGAGMKMVAVAALAEEAGRAALPSPLIVDAARDRGARAARATPAHAGSSASPPATPRRSRSPTPTARGSRTTPTSTARRRAAAASCSTARRASCRTRARRRSSSSSARGAGGVGLYVVDADAPGLTITPDHIVDLTRDQARVDLRRRARSRADASSRRAGDGAAVARRAPCRRCSPSSPPTCAAPPSGSSRPPPTTRACATQFDHPIGFFQAVKHPLVNMMLAIDQARSLVYTAACAIDHEPDDASRLARMAKAARVRRGRVLLRTAPCSSTAASASPGSATSTSTSSASSTTSCCTATAPTSGRSSRRRSDRARAHLRRSAGLRGSRRAGTRPPRRLRRDDPLPPVAVDGFVPFCAVTRHADILAGRAQPRALSGTPRDSVLLPTPSRSARARRASTSRRSSTWTAPSTARRARSPTTGSSRRTCGRSVERACRRLARRFVDRMQELGGACDFARDIALYYPLHVIMSILGVPESDEPRMLALTQKIFGGEDPDFGGGDGPSRRSHRGADGLGAYFNGHHRRPPRASRRPTSPPPSPTRTIDGQPLGDLETAGYYVDHRDRRARHHVELARGRPRGADPQPRPAPRPAATTRRCIPNAVDEMIRWVTPVRHFMRQAQEDYVARRRRRSPKGDWLLLSYLSANRDEHGLRRSVPLRHPPRRTPTSISRSASACTSASARTSRAWSCARSSASCCRGSSTSSSPASPSTWRRRSSAGRSACRSATGFRAADAEVTTCLDPSPVSESSSSPASARDPSAAMMLADMGAEVLRVDRAQSVRRQRRRRAARRPARAAGGAASASI